MDRLKKEVPSDAEDQILSIVSSSESGVSNEELTKQTMDMEVGKRGESINNLLSSGKIEMLAGQTPSTFILRLRKGTQLSDVTPEEQLIYSLIEESAKKGIWVKEIRDRSGLSQALMRKALKTLEQKKLVKSLKAVGSTKKFYILFNLDADETLTGGTFFSDQQLDSQFVETLAHVCVAMLQNRRKLAEENHRLDPLAAREFSFVRSSEVAQFITERGVCRVKLSLADVESILKIAHLDDLIERRIDGMYRAKVSKQQNCAASYAPCLHCPMVNDCKPGYVISPQNCEYLSTLLNF